MPVKVRFEADKLTRFAKKIEALNAVMNDSLAIDIGEYVTQEMRGMISKGISPIGGVGRFPGYKASYVSAMKNEPLKSLGKKQRPVNLTLTGEFLRSLSYRVEQTRDHGKAIIVGYFIEPSISKELGHATGANSQLIRGTIPDAGSDFAVTIQRGIIKRVNEAIRRFIADYSRSS